MRGYWEDAAKSAETIDPRRWLHTGDLAVMDEEGYVVIVGRSKYMVIRGGENIYPREIEEFLYTHADFAEVHVVGVPDSKFGEEFVACVRLREGADVLSAESLKSYCEGRIARYKVPKYVRCMDSFPMTVTGKVRKAELREQCRPWVTSSPESV